ncbi:MAG: hypothetical protein HC888_15090 [Candidatus Competibacteraceae bacterium]|nr:hypothetical protein [Candidatus Competibacteraceae bacterium]
MKQVDTIVLVKDIEKTREFYTRHFHLEILHDWKTMIVFKNRLAFHQVDKLFPQEELAAHLEFNSMGRGNVVIYLETENLEESLEYVKRNGIEVIHGIVTFPWNKDRIIRVKDPDGYIVEIGQIAH